MKHLSEKYGLPAVHPQWSGEIGVHALTTSRLSSSPPIPGASNADFTNGFSDFNLGDHVGDDLQSVALNRKTLVEQLQLPSAPIWLNQVHGKEIAIIGDANSKSVISGGYDGSFTRCRDRVLAIMTADCVPLVLADNKGAWIAALHCGWRSVASGIIERCIESVIPSSQDRDCILAWSGPCIQQQAFEIGPEVKAALAGPESCYQHARDTASDRLYCDLVGVIAWRLKRLGIVRFSRSDLCTNSLPDLFYSYRRQGSKSGRMATLIWQSS